MHFSGQIPENYHRFASTLISPNIGPNLHDPFETNPWIRLGFFPQKNPQRIKKNHQVVDFGSSKVIKPFQAKGALMGLGENHFLQGLKVSHHWESEPKNDYHSWMQTDTSTDRKVDIERYPGKNTWQLATIPCQVHSPSLKWKKKIPGESIKQPISNGWLWWNNYSQVKVWHDPIKITILKYIAIRFQVVIPDYGNKKPSWDSNSPRIHHKPGGLQETPVCSTLKQFRQTTCVDWLNHLRLSVQVSWRYSLHATLGEEVPTTKAENVRLLKCVWQNSSPGNLHAPAFFLLANMKNDTFN